MRPAPCLLTGVSWLLAVLIPALLMVATFALERLEAALEVRADEDPLADLLHDAAMPAESAQRPVPIATHLAHGDRAHTGALPNGLTMFDDEPGLPTRLCDHDTANPRFQPTRTANPV